MKGCLFAAKHNAYDIREQILENKFWHEVVDPHGNADFIVCCVFFCLFSVGETLDGIHFSGKPREIIIWLMFNILILYLLHCFSHLGNNDENRNY